ncbi:MAG: hypothetical protein GY932_06755, partial [Arcobacter sp.]|nr:hypothetical protein [Arcobacter sp.]
MNKYLMTMKPMDTFFFGQENKYRKKKDKKGSKKSDQAEYFQVSAFFPQQTTILGMLRYFVLQENNQIPIQSKKIAKGLIGEHSFMITEGKLDFKKIESLSPIFIRKGNENYFPNPLDLVLRKKSKCDSDSKIIIRKLEHSEVDLKTNIPNQEKNMIFFSEYNEKEGLSNFLINMKNQDDYLVYTKDDDEIKYIFEKVEKVGINKSETDKAYYKQITYKFKEPDISFASIVELDMK